MVNESPKLTGTGYGIRECSLCGCKFLWNPEKKKTTYADWLRRVEIDFLQIHLPACPKYKAVSGS
jgi:hypothetical protein